MRTFVALNLPAEERQRMHDALAPLRANSLPIRWGAPESLHVTLKFLGDIEGAEVEQLDRTISDTAARHGPLELRITGVGAFPSLRRANIVWLGIAPDPRLEKLQADLELAFSRLGYAREQRPFRPHITAGRALGGGRAPDVERLAGHVEYTATVSIDTVDLMRSHPGGTGSRYEALLRRSLAAGMP